MGTSPRGACFHAVQLPWTWVQRSPNSGRLTVPVNPDLMRTSVTRHLSPRACAGQIRVFGLMGVPAAHSVRGYAIVFEVYIIYTKWSMYNYHRR